MLHTKTSGVRFGARRAPIAFLNSYCLKHLFKAWEDTGGIAEVITLCEYELMGPSRRRTW